MTRKNGRNTLMEGDVTFRITGLRRALFEEVLCLEDDVLVKRGAKRYVADKKPGFPCRVSLRDADPGERVILLSFKHQAAHSPYQAAGPIFVRENAEDVMIPTNTVPELLRTRTLSLRAYDANDLMTEADVVDGREIEDFLARMFENARVSYVHVHFARPGCYACRVDRA
jgi:hypothetical protein